MKVNFTDAFVHRVKCEDGKSSNDYIDTNSQSAKMRLRVNKGSKAFSIVYTNKAGARRRHTFAYYPGTSLKEARSEYNKLRASINSGQDPAADEAARKEAAKNIWADKGVTFEDLVELFIKQSLVERGVKERTMYDFRNQMKNHAYPVIGKKRVDGDHMEVTPLHIKKIRDKTYDKGSLVTSNRVVKKMRQIFNWGMDELVVNTNPASGIRARHKEEERETVLDNDQIRRFWNGFKGKDVSELTSIAAKLELVTGQRTSEIVQMPKDRLKLDDRPLYFLPETKNSSIHILPLSPLAVSLVKRAMELSGDSKHLFPSPLRGGKEPMKHDVVVQAIRRKRDELGFKFTSHDLRRTMNTELSSFGYDKDLRNRILNHQGTGGVNDKVYDWHHYEPEMRKALEQWGRHLEAILANEVQEDNVISMIRAAKKVG